AGKAGQGRAVRRYGRTSGGLVRHRRPDRHPVAADHRTQGPGRWRGRAEAPRHGREGLRSPGRSHRKADRLSLPSRPSGPFSSWEIGLALRYLRAKRKEGGVATIAVISFIGIMLAVAVLISVMSIMS